MTAMSRAVNQKLRDSYSGGMIFQFNRPMNAAVHAAMTGGVPAMRLTAPGFDAMKNLPVKLKIERRMHNRGG